jgi:hypothetical protein
MGSMTQRSTMFLTALALVASLAVSPAAFAQGDSPFNQLPQAPVQTVEQTTTSSANSTDSNQYSDGLQTWQAVLIVFGGVVLLLGIAFAIMRDARARAPVDEAEEQAPDRLRDQHAVAKEAKRKQRQKDKAARAQRKQNR